MGVTVVEGGRLVDGNLCHNVPDLVLPTGPNVSGEGKIVDICTLSSVNTLVATDEEYLYIGKQDPTNGQMKWSCCGFGPSPTDQSPSLQTCLLYTSPSQRDS